MSIPLAYSRNIELQNVALASKCDLNLIFLSQLREIGITYHDNSIIMTLIKNDKVIVHVKRNQKLFILELAQPGKTMMATTKTISMQPRVIAMTGQGRPIHLVSKNERICLWYRRLAYVSNAQILTASRLINSIDLDTKNKEYNPVEILIESDESDVSDLLLNSEKLLDSLTLAYIA